MSSYYLEFVECPRCHLSIPIRPATPSKGGLDQISTGADGPSLFVACIRCMHVVAFLEEELKLRPSTFGLSPYHEGAPFHVFELSIECDVLNCTSRGVVVAVRSSDTSGEAVEKESLQWILAGLTCPQGHRFPWPPWH
jgi:hypothetical protein